MDKENTEKTDNENPEPKYLEKIFKAGKEEYLYNFDKLSSERMIEARQFFSIQQEMKYNLPRSRNDIDFIAERRAETRAFAAILMKIERDENGNIEKIHDSYSVFDDGALQILNKIKGADNYFALMEVKQDFFSHTGLSWNELMLQSSDITQQLAGLDEYKFNEIIAAASKIGSEK